MGPMLATNIREREVISLNISDLDQYIQGAFNQCQIEIDNNPNQIFSEADFERLLARLLEEKLSGSEWSVHTQLANYYDEDTGDDENVNEGTGNDQHTKRKYVRPDIALLKHGGFHYKRDERKYVYDEPSIVFELKYRHGLKENDTDIEKDFKKALNLKNGSILYVVVLADTKDEKDFKDKKGFLEEIKKSVAELNGLTEDQKTKCQDTKCFLIEKRIPKSEEKEEVKETT